jgi:methyl-accepting chemotaxis protein
MKIRSGILAFGAALIAGIAIVALLSSLAINRIRVGGPIYETIIQGKDLVADILPPPLYVVEAYLEATLAAKHLRPVDESTQKLKRLQSEFNSRQEFWRASTLEGDLKTMLTVDSYRHAMDFWNAVEHDLLPAAQRGDQAEVSAAYDKVTEAYTAHRSVIDRIVTRAEAHNKDVEASAGSQETYAYLTLAAILAGLLGLVVAGVAVIIKWVIAPLTGLTDTMTRLSSGDLGVQIKSAERRDEVGAMARAVHVFKDNAMALEASAAAAAEQDRIAGEQRAHHEANRAEIMRKIESVLNGLGAGLDRIAQGDLTRTLTDAFSDEYEKVRTDFNRAVDRLRHTLSEVAESSAEVGNAAAEISASTLDLSQRTEEQAASLEQTSAAMEEISATVRKNAQNAQHANAVATSTRSVAESGGEIVASAVRAMSRIEASSRKVSEIIVVIDEIARQTNLLALNAAVEAARAGDAGRGFAVVASEVRNLAQRSSQAAADIKDLIVTSTAQVSDGVDLVNRAGDSLHEIVKSISNVAEIVSEIANASGEQAIGIDQISKALTQMDEMTQQNSALVEENAAAARSLEQRVGIMDGLIGGFRLGERPQAGHNASPRPHAATVAVPKRPAAA